MILTEIPAVPIQLVDNKSFQVRQQPLLRVVDIHGVKPDNVWIRSNLGQLPHQASLAYSAVAVEEDGPALP